MQRLACALSIVGAGVLVACLHPGAAWTGGDTGGGSLGESDGLIPADGGDDGALANGGEGTVRGTGLQACNLLTYACATGTTCAFYGAIDPAYSDVVCGPADLCSIVTCPPSKRCVVGTGSPSTLSCQ